MDSIAAAVIGGVSMAGGKVIHCERRDELIQYLNEREIGTSIHYPIPPHLSEAYQYLGMKEGALPITEQYAKEVLSIPLYNGMTEEEQDFVIKCLNEFGKGEGL